jgi:hypothetical protein
MYVLFFFAPLCVALMCHCPPSVGCDLLQNNRVCTNYTVLIVFSNSLTHSRLLVVSY